MERPFLSTLLGGLTLLLSASGCGYTYHFRDGEGVRGEEHNEWASYFLFGIIGDHEVDVREFCGGTGTYEVTTGTNFLTWLVTGVTLGIYSPRKVNIWCNAPGGAGGVKTAYSIELDSKGKPERVTKRVGTRSYSGDARPEQANRYSVVLREGGAL